MGGSLWFLVSVLGLVGERDLFAVKKKVVKVLFWGKFVVQSSQRNSSCGGNLGLLIGTTRKLFLIWVVRVVELRLKKVKDFGHGEAFFAVDLAAWKSLVESSGEFSQ